MVEAKKQKVIIIGHGYTSRLSIIRSLAEMNCEITVIAMVFQGWWGRLIRLDLGKPIDCYSKYVHKMYYCLAKDELLVRLLLEKCCDSQQKPILIPDSDFSAMVVDNNQERLKDYFVFPHINHTPGAVAHWMKKSVQKELAVEVGMNVANGHIISVKDKTYSIPENLNYPCFTKPLATVGGGKQFLKRCDNEKELRNVLDAVGTHLNADILVEDFKAIDKEYAVVGFSNGESVTIPAIIKFVANSKSHFGVAREGVVMPTTGFELILSQFVEFVKRIGFCGVFDIDFYESDGKLYYGEMNLRFGASGYAVTKMGVNLPAMMVKHLCGDSYSGMPQYVTATATYVNERMCMDDWCYNYITESECRQLIRKADIRFVYDEQDTAPQIAFERQMKLLRFKRVMKRWMKR